MRLDISRYQIYIVSHVIDELENICNSLIYRYTSGSQVYIAPHVFGGLRNTYNLLGLRNIFDLMF